MLSSRLSRRLRTSSLHAVTRISVEISCSPLKRRGIFGAGLGKMTLLPLPLKVLGMILRLLPLKGIRYPHLLRMTLRRPLLRDILSPRLLLQRMTLRRLPLKVGGHSLLLILRGRMILMRSVCLRVRDITRRIKRKRWNLKVMKTLKTTSEIVGVVGSMRKGLIGEIMMTRWTEVGSSGSRRV